MFDIEKLQEQLPKEIEIHGKNLLAENDQFITFYHVKSKFIYKVNIVMKDGYIFLDFHEIYNKKAFNHERRVEMSIIAHALKKVIQHSSKYRVKLLSGLSTITWDWLIIEDVDAYLKRNSRSFLEEKQAEILQLFETSIEKASAFPIDKQYQYDLFICGEDGFCLVEYLDELGIVKVEEKRKVDLKIEFIPIYLSKKKVFVENIVSGFKKMGYQVQLFPKKQN